MTKGTGQQMKEQPPNQRQWAYSEQQLPYPKS